MPDPTDRPHLALRVARVVRDPAGATSFTLTVPGDVAGRMAYRPGQFLTVAVPGRDGPVARCYSMSSQPRPDGHPGPEVTITVKRTDGGYASGWLSDHVAEGDALHVLPPAGIFTPASLDVDLLLVAGGSGITPLMSIARAALDHGRARVTLVYANRDAGSVIFADELAGLADDHPDRFSVTHWWESERGLPSPDDVAAVVGQRLDHDVFVCGPAPFMSMVWGVLREQGLPPGRRHRERFVSLAGNPFGELVLADA